MAYLLIAAIITRSGMRGRRRGGVEAEEREGKMAKDGSGRESCERNTPPSL